MSDFTQWKPNDRLQMLAEALRGTTSFLNKAKIPESVPGIGGIGLGDVTTGTSGNMFERMAYGEPMLNHNANEGMFKDPQSIVDSAFLPGVGSLVGALRKGGTKVVQTGLDTGRRAAMGNMGKGVLAAGAATVAPTMVLDALRGGAKAIRKEAVPVATKLANKVHLERSLFEDAAQHISSMGGDFHALKPGIVSDADLLEYKAITDELAKHKTAGTYDYDLEMQHIDKLNDMIDKHMWHVPEDY